MSMRCPFSAENELYHATPVPAARSSAPSNENQKSTSTTQVPVRHLPGYPLVKLDDGSRLRDFLTLELLTEDLNVMAKKLWVMSTPSSASITPLHGQKVRGRDIVITENPRLHLIWQYDHMYLKPIPKYLMSHDFWTKYFVSPSSPLGESRLHLYQASLGFVRTYRHLVRYESDFRIALKEQLIPADVTWEKFCAFMSDFDKIPDEDVSPRYGYGEIRLTRLNFYIKFFLGKQNYAHPYNQYGVYFSRFYGPLLFAFALLSLVLNAMQLEMAVENTEIRKWRPFWYISRYSSAICLVTLTLISVYLLSLLLFKIADEWIFVFKTMRRKKRLTLSGRA